MPSVAFKKPSNCGSKAVSNEVFWTKLCVKRIFALQLQRRLEMAQASGRDQKRKPMCSGSHSPFTLHCRAMKPLRFLAQPRETGFLARIAGRLQVGRLRRVPHEGRPPGYDQTGNGAASHHQDGQANG